MTPQQNIATLKAVLDAFNRNDLETMKENIDPDLTYIIRGRSRVSGTYRGPEGVIDALKRIKELTNGTMSGSPEVILAEGDEIMMYMRVTGKRPDGREYDNYQAYLYRIRNGKMVEGQTIPVDQYAFDKFFED